jgi:hypothetical protein
MGLRPSEPCSLDAGGRRLRRSLPSRRSRRAAWASEDRAPAAVPKRRAEHSASMRKPHRHAPRPQGVAPHRDPPLRLRCLGADQARSSPGILSLQGLSTDTEMVAAFTASSPHGLATVTAPASRRLTAPPFRVSLPAWLGSSPEGDGPYPPGISRLVAFHTRSDRSWLGNHFLGIRGASPPSVEPS